MLECFNGNLIIEVLITGRNRSEKKHKTKIKHVVGLIIKNANMV